MAAPLPELGAHLRLLSGLIEEYIATSEGDVDSTLMQAMAAASRATGVNKGCAPPTGDLIEAESSSALRDAATSPMLSSSPMLIAPPARRVLVEDDMENIDGDGKNALQLPQEAAPERLPNQAWDSEDVQTTPEEPRPTQYNVRFGDEEHEEHGNAESKGRRSKKHKSRLFGLGTLRKTIVGDVATARPLDARVADLMDAVAGAQRNDHRSNIMEARSCREFCKFLVEDSRFENFMAFIICANALIMGLHANVKATDKYEMYESGGRGAIDENSVYRGIDLSFTVIFCVEIVIRIVGEGLDFFSTTNVNIQWNIFDFSIIFVCVVDEFVSRINAAEASDSELSSDISVLRMLRTLRLARTLRILRVTRFFRDLRVMIAGILQSIRSLVWALGLLMLVTYLFAVCILETLCSTAVETSLEVMYEYKSLFRAMYTLYKSVIGGVDWGDVSDPLVDISVVLVTLFLLYVAFAIMCVLNIITGVFVENANKITTKAEDDDLLEELRKRQKWLVEAKDLFLEAVGDDTTMDQNKFEALVSDARHKSLFRKLGIELERQHVSVLFRLIDFDDNGEVDVDEFVTGVDQLHGPARSVDVNRIRKYMQRFDKKLDSVMRELGGSFGPSRATRHELLDDNAAMN